MTGIVVHYLRPSDGRRQKAKRRRTQPERRDIAVIAPSNGLMNGAILPDCVARRQRTQTASKRRTNTTTLPYASGGVIRPPPAAAATSYFGLQTPPTTPKKTRVYTHTMVGKESQSPPQAPMTLDDLYTVRNP